MLTTYTYTLRITTKNKEWRSQHIINGNHMNGIRLLLHIPKEVINFIRRHLSLSVHVPNRRLTLILRQDAISLLDVNLRRLYLQFLQRFTQE
jgi:hypothetical protein